MGLEGARALAAAVTQCSRLRWLDLSEAYLGAEATAVLRAVESRLERLELDWDDDDW